MVSLGETDLQPLTYVHSRFDSWLRGPYRPANASVAWVFRRHRGLGATLLVIHTDEPMMLSAPITVLPPRIVALA